MPRLKITLAYDGTCYSGWQIQAAKDKAHPPTIQAALEKAMTSLCAGQRILVTGAGRTDSGVHAEGQVCHADVPETRQGLDWVRALNATLPDDIRAVATEITDPTFHACNSAIRRVYSYALWSGPQPVLPRLRRMVWSTPELDTEKMQQAAAFLTGTHDFASFQNAGTPCTSTVRTLYALTQERGFAGPLICPPTWPVTTWTIEGSGFLRQMVRNIMGLLVWAGRGKITPEAVPSMLLACRRTAVPSPAAPARGLTLMRVLY